ncbi:MAG: HAMP domain-containing histidine kinase [Actinobacteria bacterium]|nr:HAMP domain-containing histidine kinase [Actinomycetota bacterium]
MTLRHRLVLAQLVVLAVGLVVFAFVSYNLYSHSLYTRIDSELTGAVPYLAHAALLAEAPPSSSHGSHMTFQGQRPTKAKEALPRSYFGRLGFAHHPRSGTFLPPGTLAEVISPTGKVLGEVTFNFGSGPIAAPLLPRSLSAPLGQPPRIFTTGSASSSVSYRVLAVGLDTSGDMVVVAVPLTDVTRSLQHLLTIYLLAGLAVLAALGLAATLIVRRGLRPLEAMAKTADAIAEGEFSHRVNPEQRRTEVGQLGVAFDTMLDRIQSAFSEKEATEQRLRQFLADASHELRTPLTSILGYAELFHLGAEQSPADLETVMRRIEEEATRMKLLVEDLFLLARLDHPREAEAAPVDLAVLAADACSDAAAVDPTRRITLEAPYPVVVDGDELHLRQAVSNLVTNAIRHTPAGSAVEVAVHREGANATLSVTDHGHGLSEEALSHAFDRLWRGERGRGGEGSGLGLAIVAGVAAEHGGRVSACNVPGAGARFLLQIPLLNAAELTVATGTGPLRGELNPLAPNLPEHGGSSRDRSSSQGAQVSHEAS